MMMDDKEKIYILASELAAGNSIEYLNGTEIKELTQDDAIDKAINLAANSRLPNFAGAIKSQLNSDTPPYKMEQQVREAAEQIIQTRLSAIIALEKWGDNALEMTARLEQLNELIMTMRNLTSISDKGEGGERFYTLDQLQNSMDRLQAITYDDDCAELQAEFNANKLVFVTTLARSIARLNKESRS